MSRLYDRVVSGKVAAFTGDYAPQWREDRAELLAGCPVVVLDDIARFFHEVVARLPHPEEGGEESGDANGAGASPEELANLRPPGHAAGHAFFEARAPRTIEERGPDGEMRRVYAIERVPKAWGVLLRVRDLKEAAGAGEQWRGPAREDAQKTLEKMGTGARLVTDVRWFYQGTLYVEDAPFTRSSVGEKVVGPLAYLFLAVREDGTPARAERVDRGADEPGDAAGGAGGDGVAVRGVLPLLGRSGRESPEFLRTVGEAATRVLEQVSIGIALANCRGVEPVTHTLPRKLARKARKHNPEALVSYEVLEIGEMRGILEREGNVLEVGIPRALSACRRHWRADGGGEGTAW